MKYITIITGNQSKFNEYKKYLQESELGIELLKYSTDIPEIQSSDNKKILESKVAFVSKFKQSPFIVDDVYFDTDRYVNFPGPYAKFINNTLGIDGWKKLFNEGDKIYAIASLALFVDGNIEYFEGKIDGVISFKNNKEVDSKAPINNIFFVPENNDFLGNLINLSKFENHRKKAFKKLIDYVHKKEQQENILLKTIKNNWDNRAEKWNEFADQEGSYVNHEQGYERFNKVLNNFLPILAGDVLEIGCGSGQVSQILASKKELNVLSVDVSDKMIAEAKKQAKSNLIFEVATVNDVYKKKKKFDSVVSRGIIISHLPSTQIYDYLYEISAISKDGAYFIFDFLQNIKNGNYIPQTGKNEFTLKYLNDIMRELGWVNVFTEADDTKRVRVVVFHKTSKKCIYFSTSNSLKVMEMNENLKNTDIELKIFANEVNEIKHDSIEEIVKDKLFKSYELLKRPVICTDGGIFIDTLKGFPGENSKQAAIKLGPDNILKILKDENNRSAIRRNCIGFYDGKILKIFIAEIKCDISNEKREMLYKAYPLDTILIPISDNNVERKSYAEMPVDQRLQFTELPQFINFIKEISKDMVINFQ